MMGKMKSSGVQWIGNIPDEWNIRPVKAMYSLTTGFTPDSQDDSLYDDEGETWITISDMKFDVVVDSKQRISKSVAMQHKKDMVKAGSLLYSFKLSVGTVSFAGKDLYTNEAIAAFQPIIHDASLHYLKYASSLIIGNANVNIYGALIMNQKLILNAPLPIPSFSEQQAIADYLDDRCSKIDKIIAEATASIEEYKKLKQALIFEAVTKGLDRTVPIKNSGNIIIGSITATWRSVRIKDLAERITVGVVVTPANYFDENGTIPFLRGINVKEFVINDNPMVYITEETNRVLSKTIVHTGDLVIVRDGAIGVTAVVPERYDGANVVSMIIVTLNNHCSSDYACYAMNSIIGKVQFDLTKIGAALSHTSVKSVSNIEIPLPPLDEQKKIVKHLDLTIGNINSLISEKRSLIEDLQAYKKSLIYEVVTGKRRVV